jgi:acyl carrier protein
MDSPTKAQFDEIFNALKSVMMNFLDTEEEKLMPGTQLAELGLESLDYVEIQVELAKRYGVNLEEKVFTSGQVQTLEQFTNYVYQLRENLKTNTAS